MTHPSGAGEDPGPRPSPVGAIARAAAVMAAFAERTGLASDRPPRRYLWTDAFAVCAFLGLARLTGEREYADLALRLVDQVHHVLGRYRADDPRAGWISGLGEREGEAHPTRAGLRIGKPLPERGPGEPLDPELEWDRDGQYFHYLTKWMHALDQVTIATGDQRFNIWARQLAEAAHSAFVDGASAYGRRRMVWKMSTDLSRPLVASMGQHDPLDGLITYTQLETTATLLSIASQGPDLTRATANFAALTAATDLRTEDPLGLGGLLADACRVAQLMRRGAFADGSLLARLLVEAQPGLARSSRDREWRQPAARRLAFRELGLAIGLAAVERLRTETGDDRHGVVASADVRTRVRALTPHLELRDAIVSFWADAEHQQARTWSEHRDISEVMLATSLAPEGFLILAADADPAGGRTGR